MSKSTADNPMPDYSETFVRFVTATDAAGNPLNAIWDKHHDELARYFSLTVSGGEEVVRYELLRLANEVLKERQLQRQSQENAEQAAAKLGSTPVGLPSDKPQMDRAIFLGKIIDAARDEQDAHGQLVRPDFDLHGPAIFAHANAIADGGRARLYFELIAMAYDKVMAGKAPAQSA